MFKRLSKLTRFAFFICLFSSTPPVCLSPNVAAQEVASRENQKSGTNKKANANDEYAVSLLRGIIEQANSSEDIQSQAAVISDAATLVWKRDEVYARDAFKRAIDALVQDYESILSGAKLTKV
jgi:hypothetical protein